MFSPGWTEMVVLGFIALILFGKRLPEVARSFGQSFVEFKRGMTNFETDMRSTVYSDPPPASSSSSSTGTSNDRIEDDLRPSTEKFEDSESDSEPNTDSNSETDSP